MSVATPPTPPAPASSGSFRRPARKSPSLTRQVQNLRAKVRDLKAQVETQQEQLDEKDEKIADMQKRLQYRTAELFRAQGRGTVRDLLEFIEAEEMALHPEWFEGDEN